MCGPNPLPYIRLCVPYTNEMISLVFRSLPGSEKITRLRGPWRSRGEEGGGREGGRGEGGGGDGSRREEDGAEGGRIGGSWWEREGRVGGIRGEEMNLLLFLFSSPVPYLPHSTLPSLSCSLLRLPHLSFFPFSPYALLILFLSSSFPSHFLPAPLSFLLPSPPCSSSMLDGFLPLILLVINVW